jgi:hypothetical protein
MSRYSNHRRESAPQQREERREGREEEWIKVGSINIR